MGDRLKKMIEDIKKDKKRSLLILVLVGVLILVAAWPVSGGTDPDENEGNTDSLDEQNADFAADNSLLGSRQGSLSSDLTLEAYVAQAEDRLTRILSSIKGAGQVKVMITAHATREKVIGKDINETMSKVTESDSSGGTRVTDESSYGETSLYGSVSSGQDGQDPYIIKELVPEIEGVVVAAQGADDEYLVDEITQAVSVLFDLPVHKIKVVKMDS